MAVLGEIYYKTKNISTDLSTPPPRNPLVPGFVRMEALEPHSAA